MKKCFECDSINTVEEHHVVPRVLGGTKTIPLCIVCHGLVHGRDFVKSRNLQKIGIAKAKEMGKFKGRKKGTTEPIEAFIKKKNVKEICILRHTSNYSYRDIAEIVGCSLSTVQKVYKNVPEEWSYRLYIEQTEDVISKTKEEIKLERLIRKIEKMKKSIYEKNTK